MKRLYLLLIPALLLATPSLAEVREGTVWTYLYNIFGVHPERVAQSRRRRRVRGQVFRLPGSCVKHLQN